MLSKTILQGRLTKDLELKKTGNDVSVVTFSLAVERDFKGADGQREADFFDCVAWRGTADFIAGYFKRGDMMICSGRLQNRKYESDGQVRRVTELIVEDVNFCGNRNNGADTKNAQSERKTDSNEFMNIPDGIEEGLPFN